MQIIFALFFALLLFWISLNLLSYLINHSGRGLDFEKGVVPETKPDGFYKGISFILGITNLPWRGVVFEASQSKGINLFTENGFKLIRKLTPKYNHFSQDNQDYKAYYFDTYTGTSIAGNNQCIKLDYSNPENPWLLRIILNEIVEVSPGEYLGKVHLKILGRYITIGYFSLKKFPTA